MKNLTENLTGYFDVRKFSPDLEYAKRDLKKDCEQIFFTVLFDTEPEEFKEFARQYTSRSGETRWAVKFKIGERCQFYNAAAEKTDRPTNAELDFGRWEIRIFYSTLRGDPAKREPTGYWANAIQMCSLQTNPFLTVDTETVAGAADAPQKFETPAGFENTVKEYADLSPARRAVLAGENLIKKMTAPAETGEPERERVKKTMQALKDERKILLPDTERRKSDLECFADLPF